MLKPVRTTCMQLKGYFVPKLSLVDKDTDTADRVLNTTTNLVGNILTARHRPL